MQRIRERKMRYIGIIVGLLAAVLLAGCAGSASEQAAAGQTTGEQDVREMVVYRAPTCGCCTDWIGYVEEHGYTVTVEDVQDISIIKTEHNIPQSTWSCHTALVDGYIIEGHVPIEDIERLLSERPDVAGIAVPGMPVGSPGMEMTGAEPQPFAVVTFDAEGNTEVYSTHNQE
jgi:hypothetical protein